MKSPRLRGSKEYIQAVSKKIETDKYQIVIVIQGGDPQRQGTWIHPKLAIDFARWLNADFAVWCDEQIEGILKGDELLAKRRSTTGLDALKKIVACLEEQSERIEVVEVAQGHQEAWLRSHDGQIKGLESKLRLMDSDTGYCTVTAYFKRRGLRTPPRAVTNKIGVQASQVAKSKGIKLGQVSDERFGMVNSYPVEILDQVVHACGYAGSQPA